ncbi:MAG: stage II sporulation protein M [Bacteroidia bacterium]
MRETNFIRQNKEKWEQSEQVLKNKTADAGLMSDLFVQITDDLSYSRTFYKNRSVRVYLNNMARYFFLDIYKNRKKPKGAFKNFWLEELPQVVLYCKKELLLSFVVFVAAVAIGVFSFRHNPDFAQTILGEHYIEMTKENIAKGDPMAVYKSEKQVDMFLGITFNNVLVTFRVFLFGLFMGIGTLAMLFYNGVMLGVFQYFFFKQDLLIESMLSVWLHGTLEISCIIISGGAGITLGRGIIFPGTYNRLQSFQMAAIRSLKLLLGTIPILVFAAFIESFITRYTEMPPWIKLSLILVSLFFISGYFVFYPFYKSKKGFKVPLPEVKVQPDKLQPLVQNALRTNAEIIKDSFVHFRLLLPRLTKIILAGALLMTVVNFYLLEPLEYYADPNYYNWFVHYLTTMFKGFPVKNWSNACLHSILSTGLVVYIFSTFKAEEKYSVGKWILTGLQVFLFAGLFFLLQYFNSSYRTGLLNITFMFAFVWVFVIYYHNENVFVSFFRTISLMSSGFAQFFGLMVLVWLISFIFMFLVNSPLLYLYQEIIAWNAAASDVLMSNWMRYTDFFCSVVIVYFLFSFVCISAVLLHFTLLEISEANILKSKIENMRLRSFRETQ